MKENEIMEMAQETRNTNELLRTDFNFVKCILLSCITLGIYGIVVQTRMGKYINIIASPYDGKKTMHYCLLAFLIAPITLGIGSVVWSHRLCARMGEELKRRNINLDFSAKTFWLWGVLGTFIIVGPFVFGSKLFRAMNLLCEDYNKNG